MIMVEIIKNVPDTVGRHQEEKRVLRVQAEFTRAQLLYELALTDHCAAVTCLVLQGNTMWPESDRQLRFAVLGGSYTVIATKDDDGEECQGSSSSVSLLQVRLTSFSRAAAVRLPPPGKGKKVHFDEAVEQQDVTLWTPWPKRLCTTRSYMGYAAL